MRKKKRKITKNKDLAPEAMPEAAYNISPDDVEIGDDLTITDMKKKEIFKNKEDH